MGENGKAFCEAGTVVFAERRPHEKMIAALKKIGYFKNKKINLYEDLGGILKYTTQMIYEKKRKRRNG